MNSLDATAKSLVPEKQRKADDASLRPTIAAHDSPLIDEKRLCADLGISSVTATKWRAKAAGPPFIKVGRLVRYRRADVEAWLASRTVGGKSA
jgi:predicted DNA-binding transcriptional regulator AlpA